jgi:hypothetical protein
MRFFRSTWLQKILIFFFLALLNATGFGFVAKQGELKNETFIHVVYHTPCFAKANSSSAKFQLRYAFDIIDLLVELDFKKTISHTYIFETASNPVFFDCLAYFKRGPPRSMTLL